MTPDLNNKKFRKMARQICKIEIQNLLKKKTVGFTRDDKADLEMELFIKLVRKLHRYNPQKASVRTFVNMIVRNELRTIIEAHNRDLRNYQLYENSLNETIATEGGGNIERIELVSCNGCIFKVTEYNNFLPQNELDFLLDVKSTLSDLTSLYKETAKILIMGGTEQDIMRTLGVTRRKARTLKTKVRKIFKDTIFSD